MPLLRFLRQLFDHGRVTVESGSPAPLPEQELVALLMECDQAYRRQLSPNQPPLDLPTAINAALVMYRAAQLLAFRDSGIESFEQLLAAGPDATREELSPAEQYSGDLCLHFLPDLIRLARVASANDPLVACLLEVGRRWPLSSVGIEGVILDDKGRARVRVLAAQSGVWQTYIDRVLQTGDESRLNEPLVRTSIQIAIGAYPELAGKLQKLLSSEQKPQPEPIQP